MNFQITVAIASAICYVLMFVLIGFALLGLVLIVVGGGGVLRGIKTGGAAFRAENQAVGGVCERACGQNAGTE